MAARLTRWFIFSVMMALLPLWFHLLSQFPDGGGGSWLMTWLITSCSHGELLLVTAAVSGAAIGELIGSGNRALFAKLIAGVGCAVVLVLASLGFAYVVGTLDRSASLTPEAIAFGSLAMLVFGIVSSGSCVALAER